MSAVTQAGRSTDDRSTTESTSTRPRGRTRHRAALVVTVVVLGWSIVELVNLAFNHTTGPELYGLLVAALSVGAAVLNILLLRSDERRLWYVLPLVGLWVVVALGGIAGSVAHIVGSVAGHGPIDPRPRPVAAPLIFTLLGLVGGAALWFEQRAAAAQAKNATKE
jgi:4-amino-4-deoxy-L-arabinose transferase-like glycosyltransferase